MCRGKKKYGAVPACSCYGAHAARQGMHLRMSKTPKLAAFIAVSALFRCNRHPQLRTDDRCTRTVVADDLQLGLGP